MRIEGLTAVVTGGGSGLGAATASAIARAGATVAVFDSNAEAGMKIAHRIGGVFKRVDVADEASVSGALRAVEQTLGPARILVNCAGIAPVARTVGKDSMPHALALFRKAIEINLVGTFNVTSQFAARLIAHDVEGEEAGVVVNTASVAAFDGQIGQVAYAASKSGVAGITLPLARDLAQHRIRVVTVAPGLFLTPMLMGLPEAAQTSLGTQVPHPNRLGQPDEFAILVQSIIVNPMLNGEVIRLDGAIRMAPK